MGMLRLSLLAIVSCLVPFLPAYAGLPDVVAWRLSSGFFGLGWLIYYVYIVITLRGQGLLPRVSLLNRINLVGVHPSAVLSLMLGAFGLWGERTSLVYLSCILVILYLCGFLFLQQVTAISEENESDDGLQDH